MGGVHNQNVFGRWRWLDGVRAWCDAHDLVFIAGASLASVLIMLAFVATVAVTTVWVKLDHMEQRVDRIEHALRERRELVDGTAIDW